MFNCPFCQDGALIGTPEPGHKKYVCQHCNGDAERTKPASRCSTLLVICPYCEYSYQPGSGDYHESEREQTCGKCDKEFLIHDEVTVTHHTRQLCSCATDRQACPHYGN